MIVEEFDILDNQHNIENLIMAQFKQKRISKELQHLAVSPPPGVKLLNPDDASLARITMELTGADNTLYAKEIFNLVFIFGDKYPFESPQVMFTGDKIPVHPHVYSNGHICLSILTTDWSPALSVESVCLSIISMLSSCKEKKRPPDNSIYVMRASKNPKETRWWYHDDNV